jgi:DNA polymerase III delta prime subunit
MIKELLIWEKYRPETIEDMVLPDRIIGSFKNGLKNNYIFHGHYGTGKTSLARILIGKYLKGKAYLELNSSYFTSVDTLRSEVDQFCKTNPMFDTDDNIKYVFLDEFERVSVQFQDAFKAFIEKYNNNVRFILTTNHYDKISEGIKSRFVSLNFDCINKEEEKDLKIKIFNRITNLLKTEQTNIEKKDLVYIINKSFPDIRSIIKNVGNFIETGEKDSVPTVSNKTKLELFELIYKKDFSYMDGYNFILNNFGDDRIDILIKMLGKDFTDWIIENKPSDIEKLFETNSIIADYTSKLNGQTDPFILGNTILGKIIRTLK